MPTKHEVETTFSRNNKLPIGDQNSDTILCNGMLYYSLVAIDGNKPIWFDNRNQFQRRSRYDWDSRTFGGVSDNYDCLHNTTQYTNSRK